MFHHPLPTHQYETVFLEWNGFVWDNVKPAKFFATREEAQKAAREWDGQSGFHGSRVYFDHAQRLHDSTTTALASAERPPSGFTHLVAGGNIHLGS